MLHIAGGILLAIAFLAFLSDPKGWLVAVGILLAYAIAFAICGGMVLWACSFVFG